MLYMLHVNYILLGRSVNYPCNTPSAKVHLKVSVFEGCQSPPT